MVERSDDDRGASSGSVVADSATLDRMRNLADPVADQAVAAYFATVRSDDPGALFGQLVRHTALPDEDQVPEIATLLASGDDIPAWVDDSAVERGQQFFNRLVTHHFAALYMTSLPGSYAAAKGVQVLRMTSRLRTDTQRRLIETAQFLMDTATPGALDPGGVGIGRILHVRLMHAAVRWLIANDPAVTHVDDLAPPQVETPDLVWAASWGVPGNQEDLVGTWLTFNVVVYDMFDASGVEYSEQDVADHLHMWRLIGHYLGIDPVLVPLTRADAAALRDVIWKRQQAPSAAGREMTAALLAQAHHHLPRLAWPLMPTAFRHFLGDPVADMLALPPANWMRHLFGPMDAMTRVMTRGKETHRIHARFSAFFGRHVVDGIVREMRGGARPAFAIPTHLATTKS
jgi:ER-bound oxygenase mpaB/B'/Rubber oxygenase, catalytic domain